MEQLLRKFGKIYNSGQKGSYMKTSIIISVKI